jgi:hypothetical protein
VRHQNDLSQDRKPWIIEYLPVILAAGSAIGAIATAFVWTLGLYEQNFIYTRDLRAIDTKLSVLEKTYDLLPKNAKGEDQGVLGAYLVHMDDPGYKSLDLDTKRMTTLIAGNSAISELLNDYLGHELTHDFRAEAKAFITYSSDYKNRFDSLPSIRAMGGFVRGDPNLPFPSDFINSVREEIRTRDAIWYNWVGSRVLNR